MTATLGLYIARRFLGIGVSAFLTVVTLVVVVDLVELLRSNRDGVADFVDLIGLALLRAPSITITAAPFTVLLTAMACFAIMARRSELVVTRAAGVSVWGLLMPALLTAFVLGVGAVAVYNPVAAAFAARFEQLEERFFGRAVSRVTVSREGVWLRQGDATGQTVIRAQRAAASLDRIWGVSVFQFDEADVLYRRLDARLAVLEDRRWRLNAVKDWDLAAAREAVGPGGVPAARYETLTIPTDLTVERIQDSFAAPETISFWELPGFIRTLEDSGFSSARHRLHWHSLMATPIVFLAMVLVGAAFSMRHARFGGLGAMALGCLFSGFGYFFLSDIANALGASGAVPILLAAYGPPVSAVFFALGLLLHLEDG